MISSRECPLFPKNHTMTTPYCCSTRRQWLYCLSVCLFSCILCLANAWSAAKPRIVNGQRCLFIPCDNTSNEEHRLPIVLIGGLGQTISTYTPHLSTLGKDRNILVYECRGQGCMEPGESNEDYYNNVTLPFQAKTLLQTTKEIFGKECKFHVVGFSLGARIAMAAACLDNDDKLQGMSLTGIATERSLEAHVALFAWNQLLLQQDNMQGFAWNALQTTYSSEFLYQNQPRLSTWIETMCQTNSCRGIQALLQQAYPPPEDPWHVTNMARRLVEKKQHVKGQLIAGQLDVMAPRAKVEQLASLLHWSAPTIVPNCGHAVPMEAGREWRQHVLQYLETLE